MPYPIGLSNAGRTAMRDARHKEILELREQGKSYAEIGAQWNLTRERVRQLEINAHAALKRQEKGPLASASVRARNAMSVAGVRSLASLKKKWPKAFDGLPNCGKSTRAELDALAALPLEAEPASMKNAKG